MRLKHLQLQGYKTFASKTEFLFPSGVTAIIGPNGSGKSNITDAIRWVLGEQSYSTLRGKRTEDMIFSGSQSRPRAGMAEVILTLDNSDHWLPVEFSEVTISRRAYRDSQNEYRINGSRVRLRDVSELLSQSGLSRRTYTVIGQGVVDSVLSLRAQERRALFEEAAGIAHYRDKRADALRKLDETQRNLERVHDIVTEIEPRLKRLQRQAERASEHGELSGHLEHALRTWYGFRWGQANQALERAQQIANERATQHAGRVQRLQTVTEEIDRLRHEQSDLRRRLGEWHRESSLLHSQAEDVQRNLAVLAERKRQLSAQRDEHLTEIARLDARSAAQEERVARARTQLAGAQQALAQSENEAATAQAAFDARVEEREALIEVFDSAREETVQFRTEIAEQRSRREALEERVEALAAQRKANQSDMVKLNADLETQSAQIARVDAHLASVEVEQEQTRKTLNDLDMRRQTFSDRYEREQVALRRLRESEAEITARFELLSELRRDFSIYGEATRALLSNDGSANISSGILGVLAQMIQTPVGGSQDMTVAVEAALGIYAGAIVVEDWRTAAKALQHLRSSGIAGRVVLLPVEPPTGSPTSPRQSNARTKLVPLAAHVQCNENLRPLVDKLLGQAYLVPDLDTAQSTLPDLSPGGLCVTPAGDVLRSNGIIEGGRPSEQASPLAQEQDWSQLSIRRVEVGARREAADAKLAQTGAALEQIQELLAKTSVIADEIRSRWTAAKTVRDKLTSQIDRLRHEMDWRNTQIARHEDDQQMLVKQAEELANKIAKLEDLISEANARVRETTAKIEALPTEGLGAELAAAQMALAASRQTLMGQKDILRELQSALGHLDEERKNRRRRADELTDEEAMVSTLSVQLTEGQAEVATHLEALNAKIEPAETRLSELEEKQGRLEDRERLERARLREFENHLTTARLEVQRREDALGQLRSRIEEDLGLVELELGPGVAGQTPLPLHPLVSKLPIIERLPEGAEDEVKRLRTQLRRLGPINPNALDDYKELLERHDFLQEQSSDLVEASASLRKIIAEMDVLIEYAFRQTFDAVASEFSQAFTTLFGGGQARLELSDPENLSQTGVEIVAQPPGKRLQALASLSGGERALTAVALIFSILKVSPTPFCILDEVDAMLDEANIGRFRTMLESLTEFTQVVIVTHNRGTISAAETVYGVSMGADSVSQVYSIQMDGKEIQEV
jgi:chromosome segregation protein